MVDLARQAAHGELVGALATVLATCVERARRR
jgi:hypothetical protein